MINPFSRRGLTRFLTFILYGGSSTLRDYEKVILAKMEEHLPDGDKQILRMQLQSVDHVKRLHEDRMVTFYFYRAPTLPRFGNQERRYRHSLFSLKAETVKLKVTIVTNCGLLFSLEFSQSPSALKSSRFDIVKLTDVKEPQGSLPEEIDRAEHSL